MCFVCQSVFWYFNLDSGCVTWAGAQGYLYCPSTPDRSHFSPRAGFMLKNECEGKPEFSGRRWRKRKCFACLQELLQNDKGLILQQEVDQTLWVKQYFTYHSHELLYEHYIVMHLKSTLQDKCCKVTLVSYDSMLVCVTGNPVWIFYFANK